MTDLPHIGRPFPYRTPCTPASHKRLDRPSPERNSTAARRSGLYPNSKKPSTSCLVVCSSSEHCAPLIANHRQARRVWCRLRQRWTVAQWSNVMFSDESKFVLDFGNGRQWVWHQTGVRSQPPAMIADDRYGGGSVMVWGGITMTGRTELHICQGNVTGLYCIETMPLSLLLYPTPVGIGIHSSFKTTLQEPTVHMLSMITCSFAESCLSHGQRSPQTCLQSNTRWTS